mmetsp:Transcript_11214/g.33180  ORF Transcript_11214/g.33180 Transcript_11214/m.33180 type:complete len:204 (+) Transcript_11214:116-727(+)
MTVRFSCPRRRSSGPRASSANLARCRREPCSARWTMTPTNPSPTPSGSPFGPTCGTIRSTSTRTKKSATSSRRWQRVMRGATGMMADPPRSTRRSSMWLDERGEVRRPGPRSSGSTHSRRCRDWPPRLAAVGASGVDSDASCLSRSAASDLHERAANDRCRAARVLASIQGMRVGWWLRLRGHARCDLFIRHPTTDGPANRPL